MRHYNLFQQKIRTAQKNHIQNVLSENAAFALNLKTEKARFVKISTRYCETSS